MKRNEGSLMKRWQRLSSQGVTPELDSYVVNDSFYKQGAGRGVGVGSNSWLKSMPGGTSIFGAKGGSDAYVATNMQEKGQQKTPSTNAGKGGSGDSEKNGTLSKVLGSKNLVNGLVVIGSLAEIYGTYERSRYQRGMLNEQRKINREKIASSQMQRNAQGKMQANLDNAWL